MNVPGMNQREQNSFCVIKLELAKGKCNLKITYIDNEESKKSKDENNILSIDVASSISVAHLK